MCVAPQPYDSSAGWPITRAISRRHGADGGGYAIYRSSGNRCGAYIAAQRYAQQSSTLAQAIGDQWAQGIALGTLAQAQQALGDQSSAECNFGAVLLTVASLQVPPEPLTIIGMIRERGGRERRLETGDRRLETRD